MPQVWLVMQLIGLSLSRLRDKSAYLLIYSLLLSEKKKKKKFSK